MEHVTMEITGMTCGGCVSGVQKAIGAVPGAHADAVTIGSATIAYNATQTSPAAIAQAIRGAGYGTPGSADAGSGSVKAGGGCCG